MHSLEEKTKYPVVKIDSTDPHDILEIAKELGRGKRAEGYTDDKCRINPHQMASLLNANARIVKLNSIKDLNKGYHHSVEYEEHLFVTNTVLRMKSRVVDVVVKRRYNVQENYGVD